MHCWEVRLSLKGYSRIFHFMTSRLFHLLAYPNEPVCVCVCVFVSLRAFVCFNKSIKYWLSCISTFFKKAYFFLQFPRGVWERLQTRENMERRSALFYESPRRSVACLMLQLLYNKAAPVTEVTEPTNPSTAHKSKRSLAKLRRKRSNLRI